MYFGITHWQNKQTYIHILTYLFYDKYSVLDQLSLQQRMHMEEEGAEEFLAVSVRDYNSHPSPGNAGGRFEMTSINIGATGHFPCNMGPRGVK